MDITKSESTLSVQEEVMLAMSYEDVVVDSSRDVKSVGMYRESEKK